MSAFIVSDAHIQALADAAGRYCQRTTIDGIELNDGDEVGRCLLAANYASVNFRYKLKGVAHAWTFKHAQTQRGAVEIIKACQCFDYQACELPDYKNTTAARIVSDIKSRAIASLPGYDAAPWGIDDAPRAPLSLVSAGVRS